MSKTIELSEKGTKTAALSMPGVALEYLRLGGHSVQGRWYLEARWEGRVFHIEYQPNTYKFSRAGALGCNLNRTALGGKILAGMAPETSRRIVGDISIILRETGLAVKMRRSEEQLSHDLAGFMASVILQNCHPEQAIITQLLDRTRAYLEKGFITPSAKAGVQWSFGSNVEGWWFMREVPA